VAQKRAGGSTRNGRDSKPKFLGVKKYGGEIVKAGAVILKQNGTKFHPGKNVRCGRNYDLFALKEGYVKFSKNRLCHKRTIVSVELLFPLSII
jgi:large subunit ribosomal protein L27